MSCGSSTTRIPLRRLAFVIFLASLPCLWVIGCDEDVVIVSDSETDVGDDPPEPFQYPDLTGSYWCSLNYRSEPGGQDLPDSLTCEGVLTIAAQANGSFWGAYEVFETETCHADTVDIGGRLSENGAMTISGFHNRVPGLTGTGSELGELCSIIDGNGVLEGGMSGGWLALSASSLVDCGSGSFLFSSELMGDRI